MDYTKGVWRTFKLPEGWRVEAASGEQIAFSIPNEANARLIAAAPATYEALKKAIRIIEVEHLVVPIACREALLAAEGKGEENL